MHKSISNGRIKNWHPKSDIVTTFQFSTEIFTNNLNSNIKHIKLKVKLSLCF